MMTQNADPLGHLLACHERMRAWTAEALRVARACDGERADVREAASRVRRYFSIALPLHEDDEERSLGPLLLESPARAAIEDALLAMGEQHVELASVMGALGPAWSALAKGLAPSLERGAILERTMVLGALLEAHSDMEERLIFPSIATALTPAARVSLVADMQARRTPDRLVEGP